MQRKSIANINDIQSIINFCKQYESSSFIFIDHIAFSAKCLDVLLIDKSFINESSLRSLIEIKGLQEFKETNRLVKEAKDYLLEIVNEQIMECTKEEKAYKILTNNSCITAEIFNDIEDKVFDIRKSKI